MAAPGDEARGRIRVVFRMDDVSERSDTAFERELFEIFRRHRVPLTLGIIPSVCEGDFADPGPQRLLPLGEEKAAMLRHELTRGSLEAAQHGFSHQTTAAAAARRRVAEFVGEGRAEERRRLGSGKEILERALGPVGIFVPPWNQYGEATLELLREAGFETLCTGENFGAVPADPGLALLPVTTHLFDFEDAVAAAATGGDPSPVVVVLFHGYDFLDSTRERVITVDEIDQLLADAAGQSELEFHSLAGLRRAGEDLSAERYRANRAVWQLRHLTPRAWRPRLKCRYYRSTVTATAHLRRAGALLSLFYASILVLSTLGSSLLSAVLAAVDARLVWPLVLMAAFVLARAAAVTVRRRRPVARQAMLATTAAGLLLGAWLA